MVAEVSPALAPEKATPERAWRSDFAPTQTGANRVKSGAKQLFEAGKIGRTEVRAAER